MTAKCIMLQGTSSSVGKSIIASGLCRLFHQKGFKVAPFKSQNMSSCSYITKEGYEISSAQGMQAEAAGIAAAAEMNPILLKPKEDMLAQVIVMGRPLADMSARGYREDFVSGRGLKIAKEALCKLCSDYEVVVIEGAGSPAEVNLRERDIANMEIALLLESPVLLVADIDRGGVFASLLGTLELLAPRERDLVAGFIINKFRGDPGLLESGLDFLEERTGLPVLGVLPFIKGLNLEGEGGSAMPESEKADGRRKQREEGYDRLASILSEHLDLAKLYKIMDLKV